MRFLQVLFLLSLLVAVTAQAAVTLHPNCGDATTVASVGTTTMLFSQTLTSLSLSCFSFAFDSGACTPSIAGTIMMNMSTGSSSDTIDMGTLFHGSTLSSTLYFSTPTVVSFYSVYPSALSCPATLLYSIYGSYTRSVTRSGTSPYLVTATPTYNTPNSPMTFTFRTLAPTSYTASDVKIVMIPEAQRCGVSAASIASSSPAVTFSSASTLQWTTSVSTSGQFRLCLWTSASPLWNVLGVTQVFGGNPTYFKSNVVAQNPQGMGYTLRFSGYSLNSANDRVVLIADDGTPCASGVSMDPAVSLQSFITDASSRTVANLMISRRGAARSYQVCYYAANSQAWSAVPDFDTLTRDVIATFNSSEAITGAPAVTVSPATTATPTSPADNQTPTGTPSTTTASSTRVPPATPAPPPGTSACASAPYDAANYLITTNQVLVVSVNGASIPSNFDNNVATLLCISAAEVSILRFDRLVTSTTSMVYFQIQCSTSQCNNGERQAAFLKYYSASQIAGVLQASSTTFNGIAVASSADQGPSSTQIGLGVGLGVAGALLIVTVVVIGYLWHRRRTARPPAATAIDEDYELPEGEVVQGEVINVNPVNSWPYGGSCSASSAPPSSNITVAQSTKCCAELPPPQEGDERE